MPIDLLAEKPKDLLSKSEPRDLLTTESTKEKFNISSIPDPLGLSKVLPSALKYEDIGVKKVQQAIQPFTQTPSVPINFAALMGQELAELYKPSNVALMTMAGPVIGQAGRTAMKLPGLKQVANVGTKAFKGPQWLEKGLGYFRYRGAQPKDYQKLAENAALERSIGREEAQKVGEMLISKKTGQPLSVAEQRYIGRLFRNEVSFSTNLEANPKFQELNIISQEARGIMDKWSQALVKSGIPTKEAQKTINENIGQYMARMYKTKLTQPGGWGSKGLRLKLAGLKHKKEISEDVLKLLGEIKEPALPVSVRVKELSTTVANATLFNKVAQNPEWASIIPRQGWQKMPNTQTLGSLRNKWVMPSIAEDVNSISNASTQAYKLYIKMLSAWKFGKVVLNPATHARNTMSNSMLLDFSGVNHLRQMQLTPGVVKDYLTKGRFFNELKSAGKLRKGFYHAEASQFLDSYNVNPNLSHWEKMLNVLKAPAKKAGAMYQFEEDYFKLMKFTDLRMKGASIKTAANEAEKWIFDYNKIPKFIEHLRNVPFGAPFATFTYKALPRLAETMVNNPMKLYKYHAFFNAFNNASAKTLGWGKEEFEDAQENMPDYMKSQIPGMPSNLLLPYRDKYDREQYLNLEYILPVGMAPEILERGIIKGLVSNPLATLYSELDSNKDFIGRDIVTAGMSPKEQYFAQAEHAYKQLAPSTVPGGYSWNKVKSALMKKGDYLGRVREPAQVLFDVLFGLKVTPINMREQKVFKQFRKESEARDVIKELRKTMRHQGIKEEEKDKSREMFLERLKRIREK